MPQRYVRPRSGHGRESTRSSRVVHYSAPRSPLLRTRSSVEQQNAVMTDEKPGTYRVADGSPVAMDEAKATWSPIARRALEDVAGVYHHVVNSGELAEELQSASGIRTRQMIHYWIGDVLGEVSRQCHRNGEPLLSALCVHQDGSIGDGYTIALAEAYGSPTPDDLEMATAEERLRCYRHFGAPLPADGGQPFLTPAITTERTRRVPPSIGRARGHRARAVASRCRRPGCGDYCN